nr:hypothetical protein BaRGS_015289 [Batillaria attramentaria]
MIYDDDRTLVHRHVHARLELLKPTKIRIDGFRIGEDTGFGPFAWQITSPIKQERSNELIMIVATLRNIQNFSLPLMLELSEDCVHWCPQLQGLISKFHEIFPETVLRPQLRFKEPNKQYVIDTHAGRGMDLCYEKESALKEESDGSHGSAVYQRIDEYLVNKHYIHRKGPYRVGICLGMVAPSTLFGKLMPYQHSIELHEHYYIQGPQGCEADARQLFGRMVQAHVAELVENGYFPIIGVVMGLEKVRWSWEDVINKRHGFWLELEMTCSRKEPIYMKAYIQLDGWRYMMVRKHFLLHFITDDSMEAMLLCCRNTCFFEHNPAMFYESLFFSKERAAFHFQNDGTPRGGNPTSGPNLRTVGQYLDTEILRARDEADWFLAYRFLLLKSLIARDLTVLALEFGSFPTEGGR